MSLFRYEKNNKQHLSPPLLKGARGIFIRFVAKACMVILSITCFSLPLFSQDAGQTNATFSSNEFDVVDIMTNSVESNRILATLDNLKRAVETRDTDLYMDQYSRYFTKMVPDENGDETVQLNYYNLEEGIKADGFAGYGTGAITYNYTLSQMTFNTDKTATVRIHVSVSYTPPGSPKKTDVTDEEFRLEKDPSSDRWRIVWFK